MRGFIYALINLVPSVFRGPAQWIADRIFAVFDDAVRFARWIGAPFVYLARYALWFIRGFQRVLLDAYYAVRYAITVIVPRFVNAAVRTVISWATGVINAVERGLRALIATLDKWAKSAIAFVTGLIRDLTKWATEKIAWLWNTATTLVKRVFGDWATPLKLAEWIVAPMVMLILRYIYSQRDRIAAWLLRTSPQFTLWLAREITTVARRIL